MALTTHDLQQIQEIVRGTVQVAIREEVPPIVERIVERVVKRESESLGIMIQAQFEAHEERFDHLEQRFDRLERKFERVANAVR